MSDDVTKFTRGPMAPAAAYEIVRQQEGKGEYGVIDPIKRTVTLRSGSSSKNNTVTQTISTETRKADLLDVAGAFFPPAKLFTLGRMPVGTTTPTVSYEGSPEALASYADLTGMGSAAATPTDPLSSLSTGIGKIGEIIPTLLLIGAAGAALGLFGKFKRLF